MLLVRKFVSNDLRGNELVHSAYVELKERREPYDDCGIRAFRLHVLNELREAPQHMKEHESGYCGSRSADKEDIRVTLLTDFI